MAKSDLELDECMKACKHKCIFNIIMLWGKGNFTCKKCGASCCVSRKSIIRISLICMACSFGFIPFFISTSLAILRTLGLNDHIVYKYNFLLSSLLYISVVFMFMFACQALFIKVNEIKQNA